MAEPAVEQIESAEAVIGLGPPTRDSASIENTVQRIIRFPIPLKTVLVHPPYNSNQAEPVLTGTQWHLMASPQLTQNPSALAQSLGESFRATFDIAQRLGARACAVV